MAKIGREKGKKLDRKSYRLTLFPIMADKSEKNEFNVPGKYYVDSQCIGCALCSSTAEGLFDMSDTGMAYVKKQPTDDAENALCVEALESCPVQAIGDDGE